MHHGPFMSALGGRPSEQLQRPIRTNPHPRLCHYPMKQIEKELHVLGTLHGDLPSSPRGGVDGTRRRVSLLLYRRINLPEHYGCQCRMLQSEIFCQSECTYVVCKQLAVHGLARWTHSHALPKYSPMPTCTMVSAHATLASATLSPTSETRQQSNNRNQASDRFIRQLCSLSKPEPEPLCGVQAGDPTLCSAVSHSAATSAYANCSADHTKIILQISTPNTSKSATGNIDFTRNARCQVLFMDILKNGQISTTIGQQDVPFLTLPAARHPL